MFGTEELSQFIKLVILFAVTLAVVFGLGLCILSFDSGGDASPEASGQHVVDNSESALK